MAQQAEDAASTCASFFNGSKEGRQRFTVLEVIGKGSYGVVCSAVDRLTGQKVAIKRIKNVFENVADAQRILREIILLRLLKHPDVVDIKHIMLPSDPRTFQDLYMVFELMESDLHTVIGANDDLTADHHRVFIYQLLRGLYFIHEAGVVHRDLKPKNILANSNCKLTICDLGLARPLFADAPSSTVLTDYVATRWYRAPELCGCFYGTYTQAVDIWSIGCIFAEILQGRPLFPGRDAVSQLNLITDLLGKPEPHVIEMIGNPKARAFLNNMPPKPAQPLENRFRNADHQGLDLLKHLLAIDPNQRPTAAEALQHPYFHGLPEVAPPNYAPITREQFEFEMHRLTETDVRELIYMEALNYHPHMMRLYAASGNRMPPIISQLELDPGIGAQFHISEQYGPPLAQQHLVHDPLHPGQAQLVHGAGVAPQGPAFLHPDDPRVAAAVAAHEQQQLALARQQALDFYQRASAGLAHHAHPTNAALYQDPGVAYAATGHILATEC